MAELKSSIIDGRLNLQNDLNVGGDIDLDNDLNVEGDSTFKKPVNILYSSDNDANSDKSRGLMIGSGTNVNLSINYTSIQARNNKSSSTLHLNPYGGKIKFGHSDVNYINSDIAHFKSPQFSGIPTTPTASVGANSTQIANTAFVKNEIEHMLSSTDAMIYKGSIAGGATLPEANAGHTYKVSLKGVIGGNSVDVGDIVICNKDNTPSNTPSNWNFIKSESDSAVIGPNSSVGDHIAIFNGTSGKVIKDGGFVLSYDDNPSTIAVRDSTGSTSSKSFKSTRPNESRISNESIALAFRVNNSSDNVIKFCNNMPDLRDYLNVQDKDKTVTLDDNQTLKNKTLIQPKFDGGLHCDNSFSFLSIDGNIAKLIRTGGVLASSSYSDIDKVPDDGIYSKGDIRVGDCTLSYDNDNEILKFKFN